jgi:RHS repeat-associated protein
MVLSETSNGQTIHYWQGLDTLAQSDGTNVKYFGYDGLGSVRQLTDSAGAVQLAQTFDPYGNPYAKAGTTTTNLGFSGEQTDSNGFVYLRARYYSVGSGQFFQADPSRQEANLYGYAIENPVRYADPSGQCVDWGEINSYILPIWVFGPPRSIVDLVKECGQNISTFSNGVRNANGNLQVIAYDAQYYLNPGGIQFRNLAVSYRDRFAAFNRFVHRGPNDYDCDPWRFLSDWGTSIGLGYEITGYVSLAVLPAYGSVRGAVVSSAESASWANIENGVNGLTFDEGAGTGADTANLGDQPGVYFNPLSDWQAGQPMPNVDSAVIDSEGKFAQYSMNPDNPNNDGKAVAFRNLGYDVDSIDGRHIGAQDVVSQLRQRLDNAPATFDRSTPYGDRLVVRVVITGPNGGQGTLVTFWQYDIGNTMPRLVTNWLEIH